MVSYAQTNRWCRRCQACTLHYRQAANHVLHFLITCFTCGLWLIVWFLLSVKFGGWQCRECGR